MNIATSERMPFSWGFTIENKNDTPSLIQQVHGTHILKLEVAPPSSHSALPVEEADGIVTHLEDIPISVVSADCIPLLFFSENRAEPIAAIHAGWRGVKSGIIEKAVSLFSFPESLHVVIGPSIGKCCFKIREDFLKDWTEAGIETSSFLIQDLNTIRFDLLQYVLTRALNGLSPHHIHLDHYRCTVCSRPPLPSFRRNKSANPRIRSWILKHAQIPTS